MSKFSGIADNAIQRIQVTFGDQAEWRPQAGGSHLITVIEEIDPDPVGDIGQRLEVVRALAVRVAELEAIGPGMRLSIGDELIINGGSFVVDTQVSDDGLEQVVTVK